MTSPEQALDVHHLLLAWARTGQALALGYPAESVYCRRRRTLRWEEAPGKELCLDEAAFDAVEAAVLGLEPRVREIVVMAYLHRERLAEAVRQGVWSWPKVRLELRAGRAGVAKRLGVD